jgi:hypothetical protein
MVDLRELPEMFVMIMQMAADSYNNRLWRVAVMLCHTKVNTDCICKEDYEPEWRVLLVPSSVL